MMMPSIFGESLFDDGMMGFPFDWDFFGRRGIPEGKEKVSLMKTDIKETEDGYEMLVELPGYKKDEIQVQLDNGYLTIQAARSQNHDEKDQNGKLIRQERFSGSCRRSFYVGRGMTQDQIHGKFEDGILKLILPKTNAKQIEENKYIAIEG